MTKYVVAILLFVAALAGLLLYVGDDARLLISSTAEIGPFKFPPIDMSWQSAIVILTLSVIGLLGLWTFIGWLWRLPSRWKSGAGLRRRNKAFVAIEEALIAGAEGDRIKAKRRSEKVRQFVKSEALGHIISAQAAQASGDHETALTHYEALLGEEETRATGQRGLAQQMLASGNLAGAMDHAGAAYKDDKSARWAFDVLFQAQLSDHRWAEALETLKLAGERKHIEKDVAARRKAVLMTAEAQRLQSDGQGAKALDLAKKAAHDMPDFAPGAALAANLLVGDGAPKEAGKVIERAWSHNPHPALAQAYRDSLTWEEGKMRDKRITQLIRKNPDHRESQILTAEEALLAGDGVKAWSALSPLMTVGEPSARLCLLAAQAEAMLDNSQDAAVWTERAATAASEPEWTDLDPEGEAFAYTDQDWRRLVYSFGESGDLIHPRFETGAARRAVIKGKTPTDNAATDIAPDKSTTEPTDKTQRQPDDPGADAVSDTDDLALRLDSLLGDKQEE